MYALVETETEQRWKIHGWVGVETIQTWKILEQSKVTHIGIGERGRLFKIDEGSMKVFV